MTPRIVQVQTADGDSFHVAVDDVGRPLPAQSMPPERRLEMMAELPTERFTRFARFVGNAGKVERTSDEDGPVMRVYGIQEAA